MSTSIARLLASLQDFEFFVRIDHIRKCFTQKGGIFVLEEFNPKTRQVIQRKYKSSMADQICYSVLCVFSYVAAGSDKKVNISKPATPSTTQPPRKLVEKVEKPVLPLQTVVLPSSQVPPEVQHLPPPQTPEPGTVTPVGGPPAYPPPQLPPGVPPPAAPPGKMLYSRPSVPPPVPSRQAIPTPPPRPK